METNRAMVLEQHQTHLAYSGPETIDAVALFRPDVVLLDLGLPGQERFFP